MKKNTIITFKSNFLKEQDPFHLVVIFFIIFFGTAIFFSIPTFYDYTKFNQEIKETINKDYKIQIDNLENISFRFIPSPHLLIKKSEIKIKNNEIEPVANLKNTKVYISLLDFYKKDKFNIKRIEIDKANLYLNNLSLINLIQNLKNNIVKKIKIKKSTIFFKNKKNEVILLSKIQLLNYRIDFQNNKKIFEMNGNLFDSNYEFKYSIDYKSPNIQNVKLELRNPNILFENKLIENLNSSNLDQEGILNIEFLSNKNNIKYEIKKNNLNLLPTDTKNSNFDIIGSINFKPFHFNLIFDLKEINLIKLENIFYNIYKNKKLKLNNLSGTLKINFSNIDNKVLKTGSIDLKVENSDLITKKDIFNLSDFANLQILDYQYLDNSGQILQMKIKINISDREKFNRFLFNFRKNKINHDNLYFIYQFDNESRTNLISKISNKEFLSGSELYKFNNLQQLKVLLKDEDLFMWD